MAHPDILVLMGDEHPYPLVGCYGHPHVQTPTIDALARTGTVLDAAYCPSPICAPSRAAMLTGCHVHRIQVWDNASPLACDWPTFAHRFRAAGYRTVLAGKMHFVGADQHHGFEERWTQDIYPADFRWTRPHTPEPPVNQGQNIDRVFEASEGWTEDMDYDEEVAFRTEYGLRQSTRQHDARPLLLVVSFTGPHYPFRAPAPYWQRVREEDIALPWLPPDWRAREHAYVGWLRRHGKFDRLVPDDVCRRARRAILARVAMVDAYLARVLAAFTAARGTGGYTVYTSDHGEMLGEHGLWFKNAAYEWSSRVPFVIAGPGIPVGRLAQPVSLIDLGPTLGGLAGVPPLYDAIDGTDRSPLLTRQQPEDPDGFIFVENYGEGMHRGLRTIRQGRWKCSIAHGHAPELFDLVQDPGEWENLAEVPAQRAVRDRLLTLLHQGWDAERLDLLRWESERRRLALLAAAPLAQARWQLPSPPLPHAYTWMRAVLDQTRARDPVRA